MVNEELNEFNLLKEDIEEVWYQCKSFNIWKRRLVHLIDFLKDSYDVCEFIITFYP